jgi:hypothetical protein
MQRSVVFFGIFFLFTAFLYADNSCLCQNEVVGPPVELKKGFHSAVGFDSVSGNFYLASARTNGGKLKVVGELFDPFGNSISDEFEFQSGRVEHRNDPKGEPEAIAYNSSQRQFMLIWSAAFSTPGDSKYPTEVRGAIIDANGTVLVPLLTLVRKDDSTLVNPVDITYNSVRNEYLLTYRTSFKKSNELFLQRLEGNGNKIGGAIRAVDEKTNTARVRFDPSTNRYLLVWPGKNEKDEQRFKLQIFTADLNRINNTKLLPVEDPFSRPIVNYVARNKRFVVYGERCSGDCLRATIVRPDGGIDANSKNIPFDDMLDIKPNPKTGGYLALYSFADGPNDFLKAARLNSQFQVVQRNISVVCDQLNDLPTTPNALQYSVAGNKFYAFWDQDEHIFFQRIFPKSQGSCN